MGRELRRVPLDFDWPQGKIWKGYLPEDYHQRVEGLSDDEKDAWWEQFHAEEEHDPPTGDGYQLWETTSEGSPISPVFATLDELCAYAEKHCSTFGSFKTSAAEWKRMLQEDFVCHQEGNFIFM
jgi:hypothetical protein